MRGLHETTELIIMIKYSILIILCVCFELLYANLSHDIYKTKLTRKVSRESALYQKDCFDIFEAFAQSASNFTLCSLMNARPIRFCENCVQYYVRFHDKYQELQHTAVNETSCSSIFMSQDRLNIIQYYYDSILGIWNKGNCNNCFDWVNESAIIKNSTTRFYKLFNSTIDCIESNKNSEKTLVCEKCMQIYIQLDEFYKTLSKDKIGVDCVCMDIVDSMNATRSIWSKILECCTLRETPEVVFLICTGLIGLLPVLFYIIVRFCGPIRDLPNVLKESRFKQSILRSINSRRTN